MITYQLKINGQDPRVLYSDMEFVAGDVGAYRMVFSFYNGVAPISLSDKALVVKIKRADGVVLADSGKVTGDTAVYTPKNECFAAPGAVVFEVALVDGAKNYITTKIIHATVLQGVGEPKGAAEENVSVYVSLLSQAQSKIDASNALLQKANNTLLETKNLVTDKADVLQKTTEIGKNLTIADTAEGGIFALSILGESTQDGTPTPTNPIDIVSVENPTVTVGNQTVTIPYTLRGLGNTRDEIVVNTQNNTVKLIRCIKEITLTRESLSSGYINQELSTIFGVRTFTVLKSKLGIPDTWSWPIKMRSYKKANTDGGFTDNSAQILFAIHDNRFTDVSTAISLLLGEQMLFALATPAEADITDTDCGRALLGLKTAYPQTTIFCGADCRLTYRADTTGAYNALTDELDALKQAIITMGGSINV